MQNQTERNLPAPLDHDERPDKGKRKDYIFHKNTYNLFTMVLQKKRKERKIMNTKHTHYIFRHKHMQYIQTTDIHNRFTQS